jgi:threonyl-tRNA synthetase
LQLICIFCRGPHVMNSSVIGDVALTSCSAVHLHQQGPSTTVQCQRVSGTAAPSRSELAALLAAKEVAKTRDHRLLGTSMGLFFFDNVSPGSAFFTPYGTRFYNALLQWMRDIYKVEIQQVLLLIDTLFSLHGTRCVDTVKSFRHRFSSAACGRPAVIGRCEN